MEAKLSSNDPGSVRDSVGVRGDTIPLAIMIQNFKSRLEEEEEGEALKLRQGA